MRKKAGEDDKRKEENVQERKEKKRKTRKGKTKNHKVKPRTIPVPANCLSHLLPRYRTKKFWYWYQKAMMAER